MKESENEAMFELVRKVPTELSQEKVMQIIGTLPNLPPPSGNSWFNNINLNSIIMTTTTVAIITSAVIYFSSPKTDNLLPGQNEVSTAEIEMNDPSNTALAADDSIEAIKEIPQPSITTAQAADSIDKMELAANQVVRNASTPAITQRIEKVPTPDSIGPVTYTKPLALSQTSSNTASPNRGVDTPAPTKTDENRNINETVTPAKTVEAETNPKPARVRGMDDLRLKRLKRTLLRELSKDLLIKNKRAMNVLQFKEGEIVVNNQVLSTEEFIKYSELLFKFRVEPGPEKRVVTDPKFVMVGSFTEAGFDGSMHGRALNLKFIDDGVILNGLLSDDGTTMDGIQSVMLFDEPKGEVKAGDVVIQTEGKVQDAQENAANYGKLFSENASQDVNTGAIEFKNAATISTIFDGSENLKIVRLKTNEVKSFKKELYNYLVADRQVNSKKDPVIMLIRPTLFKVNDKPAIQEAMKQRYIRLLQKYNIPPAVTRKVVMNHDFIMIGDFNMGEFRGTAQGTIKREGVKGTIIEEELNRSKLFAEAGEPAEKSEEREVAPFNKLRVSGLAVVYLNQGKHRSIIIDVTGFEPKDVITESKNGLLNISTADKQVSGESISIYVTSPKVNSIEVEGAAEVFSQGLYKADILKLISKGSGSIEMAIDAQRLHLQMDGGDIHLEGKAGMEKVDFLPESDRGTLDQSGLNVLERWTHEGGQTWSEQDLPELRQELLSKLIAQGYISTYKNPASIQLRNTSMTVNGMEIAPNYLDEYRALYSKYGLPTHANSRIWIDPDFMVIAEKSGKVFELEVMGTELELNIEGSWAELEEAILHRQ